MKLYGFPPSPNTRKVHAVALHLGIPIEFQFVDLTKGGSRTPEFLKLNPTGRTPVLVDGELVLWESTAIMQYLAAHKPSALWPDSPAAQADVLRWLSWQLAHWSKACEPLVFEKVVKPFMRIGAADPVVVKQAHDVFHKEAAMLDAHLSKRAYMCGEALSLADFSVAAYLPFAQQAQFPLGNYANVRMWYGRMESLPAWQQSAPKLN